MRPVKEYTVEGDYNIVGLERNSDVRIRGSNHSPGTEFETDTEGNPLPDSLATHLNLDGPAEAWADLWFYSNPIFLEVK